MASVVGSTPQTSDRSQWREESFAWSKGAIGQEKTRDQAIHGLLLVGDKEAIDLLFAFVNDAKISSRDQTRAVAAMWFNHNPLIEEPLRHVLDHHPSTRFGAAADALNGFRSKASGEALVRALGNRETVKEAVGSLRFYPYKEFLDALLPFLNAPDADVRNSARIAVDAIRRKRSEEVLLEQLGHRPRYSMCWGSSKTFAGEALRNRCRKWSRCCGTTMGGYARQPSKRSKTLPTSSSTTRSATAQT